jgi:hypothetical protein
LVAVPQNPVHVNDKGADIDKGFHTGSQMKGLLVSRLV